MSMITIRTARCTNQACCEWFNPRRALKVTTLSSGMQIVRCPKCHGLVRASIELDNSRKLPYRWIDAR